MFYFSIFDSMEDTLELTKITVLYFTWRTSEQVGRLQTKVDLLLQVEIVLQRRLVQTARPEGKVRGGAAKAFLRRSWGPLNREIWFHFCLLLTHCIPRNGVNSTCMEEEFLAVEPASERRSSRQSVTRPEAGSRTARNS